MSNKETVDYQSFVKGKSEIDKILELIDSYWRFDNHQQPLSNWHEKQDLLDEIRKFKSK